MKPIFQILNLLIFAVLCNSFPSPTNLETILASPRQTSFGEWGDWERCPNGTYAMGMRLKTEPFQGPLDDTGLNGIQLLCGRTGDSSRTIHTNKIESNVGKWGSWGSAYECPDSTFAVGFQLRSERLQREGDNTAANNLRIYCSDSTTYLEGAGLQWGTWTSKQECLSNQAICGLRTQVQMPQGTSADDTSLNNVDMECCEVVE